MRTPLLHVVLAVLGGLGLTAIMVSLLARKGVVEPRPRVPSVPEVEFQVEAPEVSEPPRRPSPPSDRLPSLRRPAGEPPPFAKAAPSPSALKDPAVGLESKTSLSSAHRPDGLGQAVEPTRASSIPDAREVTDPPAALHRPFPRYPRAASAQGKEGFVVLRILIDPMGRVLEAHVVRARPPGIFEEAAVAALRAWRFRPARNQGRPVAVWARQALHFELR